MEQNILKTSLQSKIGQENLPVHKKNKLDKDDFLKIMTTQMKNQDPTNPFKAENIANEIAQFTSVEQLQNVNQNLKNMESKNKPTENLATTHLIGKWIKVGSDQFHYREGDTNHFSFVFPKNANFAEVHIMNDLGQDVFQKKIFSQKEGNLNWNWNGIQQNSDVAKNGIYKIKIVAEDKNGNPIIINPEVRTKVIGVSFDEVDPKVLIGNSQDPLKVSINDIISVQIDKEEL